MTLNKDAVYTVRGYAEKGQPKMSCEAKGYQQMTIAVRAYAIAGCKAIDIDVLESTGQSCQNG